MPATKKKTTSKKYKEALQLKRRSKRQSKRKEKRHLQKRRRVKKQVSPSQAEQKPSTPSKSEAEALVAKRNLSPKDQEKLNERIRNLILLSKEQSFLTYKDINQALPDSVNNPDEIENVISILQNLEVEILDDSELKPTKHGKRKAKKRSSNGLKTTFWMIRSECILNKWASPPPDARGRSRYF